MNKRKKSIWGLLIICLMAASAYGQPSTLYNNLEFPMQKVLEPTFMNNNVSIADYGAVPDGLTVNTKAIANAIDAVAKKGGGTVTIPRGIWLTGPIELQSNINLHAETGALIIFSKNFDDYPLVETSFEGLNTMRCMSPINGRDLENVAITGEGVFDGSGEVWRQVKKSKLTSDQWKILVASGGLLNEAGTTWYPSEKSLKGAMATENFNVPDFKTKADMEEIKDFLRPVMVSLINCKKVLLDGPTFQNSPAWCLHPLMSENVTLRNLTVRNPWFSQNGDGLDLESCRNVMIYNCSFDVGDDAICFKSGKDKDGRERAMPTENVIVSNCTVYHGHGGFVIGSEMSGGVQNVHVSNCTFIGTDVGLRFKSTRGRGGLVRNIYISNIDMVNIPAEALLFDLYYSGNSPVPTVEEKLTDKKKLAALVPPVTEETPSFENIFVKNVTCKGAGRAAFMQGLPEMNLKNIQLTNIKISSTHGIDMIDSDGIVLDNVTIQAEKGYAVQLKNSKNVTIRKLGYGLTAQQEVVKVEGNLSKNILFSKSDFKNAETQIAINADVDKKVVRIK